jgi:hypothetical protein
MNVNLEDIVGPWLEDVVSGLPVTIMPDKWWVVRRGSADPTDILVQILCYGDFVAPDLMATLYSGEGPYAESIEQFALDLADPEAGDKIRAHVEKYASKT